MIVSEPYKLVFVRYPKCGTVSVLRGLNLTVYTDQTPNRSSLLNFVLNSTGKSYDDPHHIPFFEFNKLFPDKKVSNYFSFSFTRNPWDRIVSGWHYRKTVAKDWMQAKGSDGSFKYFVNNIDNIWSALGMNTLDFAQGCQFIGKFENFQNDFDIVCDKINIPRKKLERWNATKHEPYTEYYDDETREIIAEKYAKDIEYFGYKFGE